MDRLKELDVFRGIAAFFVVLYHYLTRYDEIFDSNSAFSFAYGWLGVPVFFILSGFVIHLTIDKCKTAKEFLIKRFIRLYPTFWICMSLTLLAVFAFPHYQEYSYLHLKIIDIIFNFTMFHELFHFKHIDGAYWSLLPELLFYLLMAFLLFIKKLQNFHFVNASLITVCLLHYFFPLPIVGRILDLHFILLFTIGICFYKIYSNKNEIINHVLIALNYLVGVCLFQVAQPWHSLQFLYISFAIIIMFYYLFVFGKLKWITKFKFFLFLGNISYALYLVHQNIGYVIINLVDKKYENRLFSIICAICISVLLAYIITYKLEPVIRKYLRNKLLLKSNI